MPMLAMIVLQILLIVAELFVLGAFTGFEWTQKWALWLIWNGGLSSALATAVGAHLVCSAVLHSEFMHSTNLHGRQKRADISESRESTSSNTSYRKTPGFMRLILVSGGGIFLLYSVLAMISVSEKAHSGEIARLRPLIERHASAAARASSVCQAASTNVQHRPLQELDIIIADEKSTNDAKRKARAERAAVIGRTSRESDCVTAESHERESRRDMTEAVSGLTATIAKFMPEAGVERAALIYSVIQGGIVWLFAFGGAAWLHAAARSDRQINRALENHVPATDTPLPSTPVIELGRWLEMIVVGSDSVRVEEVPLRYAAWCRIANIRTVDGDIVKKLTAWRMSELGVRKVRRSGVWHYKDVSMP